MKILVHVLHCNSSVLSIKKIGEKMFLIKFRQFVPKSIAFRNMATVKRFYRRTNILASGDKFEITLDQRKLKTPKGRVLEVTSEPLALAIALEWDSQEETINRSNMHLTSLCSTFLDNPHQHSRADIVNYIANYLETDTILFHSSEMDELYKLQSEKWDTIIQWFCDCYRVDITKTQSINPPNIPEQTKASLIRHMSSYSQAALQDFHNSLTDLYIRMIKTYLVDNGTTYKNGVVRFFDNYTCWEVIRGQSCVGGFLYAVDTLKSVILTMAIVERKISVEEAVALSRLEEEFQISHWGNVEWSHELSKQDLQARVAAATLFIHLNSYTATSQPKEDRTNTTV